MAEDILVPDLIRREAKRQGVPVELALGIAEQESSFNPGATGPEIKGGIRAKGTYQLLPETAKRLKVNPDDPYENVRGGISYLKELMGSSKGDLDQVIRTYGGVKRDTKYLPSVLARIQKYQTEGTKEKKPVAPASVPGAPKRPAGRATEAPEPFEQRNLDVTGFTSGAKKRPQTREELRSTQRTIPLEDVAKGAKSLLVEDVDKMTEAVSQRFPSLEKLRKYGPTIYTKTTRETKGEKIGAGLAEAGEFAQGGAVMGGLTKSFRVAQLLTTHGIPAARAALYAAAVEGSGQATSGYAITRAKGGSKTEAAFNAAFGMAGSLLPEAVPAAANYIKERAKMQLARVLSKGLETKGPMIDFALKSRDRAMAVRAGGGETDIQQGVKIVRQAASDMLDLPIQASWGAYLTTLGENAAKKGASLEAALRGPMGEQILDKTSIVDNLKDLISSAGHADPQTGKFIVDNPTLVSEAQDLIGLLTVTEKKTFSPAQVKAGLTQAQRMLQSGQQSRFIKLRDLVNIKRTWDDVVYSLSTVGKVGISPDVLIANSKEKAAAAGANEIRRILASRAPDIADLNEAVTNALRLQDLALKLYAKQPGMAPLVEKAITVAGTGLGYYLSGHWYGAPFGGGVATILTQALKSPYWRAWSPMMKNHLAETLAHGNIQGAIKLLTPFIQRGSMTKQGQQLEQGAVGAVQHLPQELGRAVPGAQSGPAQPGQ